MKNNFLNKIICDDAKDALKKIPENSVNLVYLDPPYMPEKEQSFTSYTAAGFGPSEQERLRDICDKLTANEVKWIQSNSNSPVIKDLYKEYNIKEVTAPRSVSAKGDSRKSVTELIITNY